MAAAPPWLPPLLIVLSALAPLSAAAIDWKPLEEAEGLISRGRQIVLVQIDEPDVDRVAEMMEEIAAELHTRRIDGIDYVKWSPTLDMSNEWLRERGVSTDVRLAVFDGDRTTPIYLDPKPTISGMTKFLLAHVQRKYTKITTEREFEEFTTSVPVTLSIFLKSDQTDLHDIVYEIINRYHDTLPIGLIIPADRLEWAEYYTTSVLWFNYQNVEPMYFVGEERLVSWDMFALDTFIKQRSRPLVERFPADADVIFKRGTDRILFYFGDAESYSSSDLHSLGLDVSGHVIVAHVDGDNEQLKGVRELFGVKTQPTVRGFNHASERQYRPIDWENQRPMSMEEVREFALLFKVDQTPVFNRTQPLPPTWNDGPVKVLNAENFEQIALDASVTSIVLFYADWCKHSARAAPRFDAAAGAWAAQKDTVEEVVFAKIDAPKNDVRMKNKIRVFPTIVLFKRGSNREVLFNGRLQAKDVLEFVTFELALVDESEEEIKDQPESSKIKDQPIDDPTPNIHSKSKDAEDTVADSLRKKYDVDIEIIEIKLPETVTVSKKESEIKDQVKDDTVEAKESKVSDQLIEDTVTRSEIKDRNKVTVDKGKVEIKDQERNDTVATKEPEIKEQQKDTVVSNEQTTVDVESIVGEKEPIKDQLKLDTVEVKEFEIKDQSGTVALKEEIKDQPKKIVVEMGEDGRKSFNGKEGKVKEPEHDDSLEELIQVKEGDQWVDKRMSLNEAIRTYDSFMYRGYEIGGKVPLKRDTEANIKRRREEASAARRKQEL